jgi:hypothetical protein
VRRTFAFPRCRVYCGVEREASVTEEKEDL